MAETSETISETQSIVVKTPVNCIGHSTVFELNGKALQDVTSLHVEILPDELVKLTITQQERDADGNIKLVGYGKEQRVAEKKRAFTGQLSILAYRVIEFKPG